MIKVEQFIEFIKSQQNSSILLEKWNSFYSSRTTSTNITDMKSSLVSVDVDNKKKKNVLSSTKNRCKHIMTKGGSVGNQCSSSAKEGGYCTKHMKSSNITENKVSKNKKNVVVQPTEKKVFELLKRPTLVLTKNEHGNYEHFETGYVFKKFSNSHIVVGKQVGKDIVQLNDDDLYNCKKYGFNTNQE